MDGTEGINGWPVWSKHVLAELQRLDESNKLIVRKLEDLRTDVAVLKVKYAILGGLFGAIPGIIAIILRFV